MADNGKAAEDLEELFKTFDRQHAEAEQKFLEVEKNLLDFRNEKNKDPGDEAGTDAPAEQ